MARQPGYSLPELTRHLKGVLVRLPNWMGDMLMSRPALAHLREGGFHEIIGLVPDRYLPLARMFPELDTCIPLSDLKKKPMPQFDDYVGLALPNSLRSVLDLKRAGCPVRIGYRMPERMWGLTHAFYPPKSRIWEVERFFRLAHTLVTAIKGRTESYAPVPPVPPIVKQVSMNKRTGNLRIVIHTGASKRPRRWPIRRFVQLAEKIKKDFTPDVRLFMDEPIQNLPKHLEVHIYPPLEQLIDAVRTCDLFIGNDAGPAHLAAAFDRKTVILYGPGHPSLHRPAPGPGTIFPVTLNWACSPCRQRFWKECCPIEPDTPACLYALLTEDVIAAVRKALSTMD